MNQLNNNKINILVIEKEQSFKELLKLEMSYRGIQIDVLALDKLNDIFATQADFLSKYSILLIGLDNHDTVSIVDKIRKDYHDIWILCINNSVGAEKINIYNHGVDDIMPRNVSFDELYVKLSNIFRRIQNSSLDSVLQYSDIKMNLITREVFRKERPIDLRSKEFDLLKVFLQHSEETLSREYIFNQVWGFDFLGDSNVIEVYIRYLRSKLGKPNLIRTKRGQGYIIISDEAQINKVHQSPDSALNNSYLR